MEARSRSPAPLSSRGDRHWTVRLMAPLLGHVVQHPGEGGGMEGAVEPPVEGGHIGTLAASGPIRRCARNGAPTRPTGPVVGPGALGVPPHARPSGHPAGTRSAAPPGHHAGSWHPGGSTSGTVRPVREMPPSGAHLAPRLGPRRVPCLKEAAQALARLGADSPAVAPAVSLPVRYSPEKQAVQKVLRSRSPTAAPRPSRER